jgi:hypothetical protein
MQTRGNLSGSVLFICITDGTNTGREAGIPKSQAIQYKEKEVPCGKRMNGRMSHGYEIKRHEGN